jgi:hypothetical protein
MSKNERNTVNLCQRVWESIQLMEQNCNGYTPRLFMKMIDDHGVVDAIKRLINTRKVSEGFTKLWKCNHLELSMENIIQEEAWVDLFTENDRKKARERLAAYGYTT